MKLFSILNKPANKVGNKQAGIVFLEYVIMAFIITVAVICALWWFYWHLQQLTWEIKSKLEVLKTLNCELQPPYGAAPGEQPTPGPGNGNGNGTGPVSTGPIIATDHSTPGSQTLTTSYADQTITVFNISGMPMHYGLHYGDGVTPDGGGSIGFPGPGLIHTPVQVGPGPYTVTINVWPDAGLGGTWPLDYIMDISETTP